MYRSPSISFDCLIVAFNGSLRAVDVNTGEVRWKRSVSDFMNPVLHVDGDELFVCVAGELVAIGLQTGVDHWKVKLPIEINAHIVKVEARSRVVLVTTGGVIFALGREDGALRWQMRGTEWV